MPSTVCLQETHLRQTNENYLKEISNDVLYHALAKTKTRGVLLDIRKSLDWTFTRNIIELKARFIIIRSYGCHSNNLRRGVMPAFGHQAVALRSYCECKQVTSHARD